MYYNIFYNENNINRLVAQTSVPEIFVPEHYPHTYSETNTLTYKTWKFKTGNGNVVALMIQKEEIFSPEYVRIGDIEKLSNTTKTESKDMVTKLRELGFTVTYPPPSLLKDIQGFLQSLEVMDAKTTILGNMVTVGLFMHGGTTRAVVLAPTDNILNVNILVDGVVVFRGEIESLEEFELIWNRVR